MSIGPRQQHHRRTPAATSTPVFALLGLARIATVWPGILGVVGALLAMPATSQAWTESTIKNVQADLAVDKRGQLLVELHVQLEVRAGWLSRLELSGLDTDLQVDPEHPPIMISDEGGVFLPEIEVLSGGTIELTFPRRVRAPRRGQYALSVTYTTAQPFRTAEPAPDDRLRVRWHLPAWETGLENIVVQVTVEGSARALAPTAKGARQEISSERAGGATLLRFHRAKLPRMTPMTITFELPSELLPESAVPATEDNPTRRTLRQQPRPQAAAFFGGGPWLALALLGLLRLFLTYRRARHQRLKPQFLMPRLGPWARALWVVSLAGLGTLFFGQHAELSIACGLALMLPALERRASALPLPDQLERRAASADDLRRLRRQRLLDRFDLHALLDPTTPLGALSLTAHLTVSCTALPITEDAPRLLAFCLLSIIPFLSGTRRMHPPSLAERTHLLLQERNKLGQHATEVMLYRVAQTNEPCEVRLAFTLTEPLPGLQQASLVLGEHHWLDRCLLHPCWLLLVEVDSPAERAARKALPAVTPMTDPDRQRLAFLATAVKLEREASALCGWLSAGPKPQDEQAVAA